MAEGVSVGLAEATAAAHWFAEQLYDNGTDQQTIFEDKLRVRTAMAAPTPLWLSACRRWPLP